MDGRDWFWEVVEVEDMGMAPNFRRQSSADWRRARGSDGSMER